MLQKKNAAKKRLVGLTLILLLFLFGCNLKQKNEDILVVMAAASLTDSFTELAQVYEEFNPETSVRLNFAGTQTIRTQLEQGVESDVFAAANRFHMQALKSEGLVLEPVTFAKNRLTLIVPSDNPAGISDISDLVKPHRLVLALEDVPVGAYSRKVLKNADNKFGRNYYPRVLENLVSEETNVRNVRTKITLGEADAGIVYKTDVIGGEEDLKAIQIPDEFNVSADYYIALVDGGKNREAAAFIDFILSPRGREILNSYGFE